MCLGRKREPGPAAGEDEIGADLQGGLERAKSWDLGKEARGPELEIRLICLEKKKTMNLQGSVGRRGVLIEKGEVKKRLGSK